MSHARVRLFGVPALENAAGAPVRLRSKKQLGVLVYLVLEGREQAVSRERLVDLLWDGVPAAKGRHSLAQASTALRAALGRDALERVGAGLRLRASVVTDLERVADEFDRLELAEPLREADWWAGAEFAHWVDGARGRLRRAAEGALRGAIAGFRRSGETARVHACAAVLYRLDPLSDVAVHALAERELVNGDVVGAIRLLRAHLERVREALGCVPHADVERLLRRLEAGAHPPLEVLPARLAAEGPRLRPAVFVARERELAHLEAEWQRVWQGGFRSCLVLGPGGIGKSSLVRRWAATVAARAQPVFLVTCQEIGGGIPFAAISDLIAALCRDPSVSATDPQWLAEVARIYPALRSLYPGVPEPPEAPPESIRLRVAEGLVQMLDAIADGGPVGIVFDDLQFMDGASREVIYLLSRRLDDRGILLLAAARTLAVGHAPIPGVITSPLTWSTTLLLGPLAPSATRQLVRALSAKLDPRGPSVVERIVAISDGNPQFAEMLVADWERHAATSLAAGGTIETMPSDWQPPDSLRHAFARLYDGLSEAARHMLHVLAVAGRALTLDEIAAALPRQQRGSNSAAMDLLTRGILRFEAAALGFKNELHRAYVYYAITEDSRRLFHAQLGKALLRHAFESQDIQRTLEATAHLSKAGHHGEAASAVIHAAPTAIRSGAPAEAETAIRTVLANDGVYSVSTHSSLQLLLADALSSQGRYAECLRVLGSLRAACSASSSGETARAAFLEAQALQRTRLADSRSIAEAVRRAAVLANSQGDADLVGSVTQVAAEVASELGLTDLLRDVLSTVDALASWSRRSDTRARAILTQGFCLMASGDFQRGYDAFSLSAQLLREQRLETDLARALKGQVICLLGLGQHHEISTPVASGLALSYKLNDSALTALFVGNLGLAYEELGQFREAAVCYQRAAQEVGRDGNPRLTVISYTNLAHISMLVGDLCAAAGALAVAEEAAKLSQLWRFAALTDYTRADLLLAGGEEESAWPRVASAVAASGGKERAIDTNGQALRLQLQYQLANYGLQAFRASVGELEEYQPLLRPTDTVEVTAFLRWAFERGHLDAPPSEVWTPIAEPAVLIGPLGTLAAVGLASSAHALLPGESADQMLDRVYGRAERTLLPSPSDFGLPVEEGPSRTDHRSQGKRP